MKYAIILTYLAMFIDCFIFISSLSTPVLDKPVIITPNEQKSLKITSHILLGVNVVGLIALVLAS